MDLTPHLGSTGMYSSQEVSTSSLASRLAACEPQRLSSGLHMSAQYISFVCTARELLAMPNWQCPYRKARTEQDIGCE